MELPDFFFTDSDGEICFKGHRIRLIDVAARYEEGHSPETIVLDHYPTLELSLAFKAVAFYLENEAEVRALMEENAREIGSQMSQPRTTPTLAELRKRMEARRRAEAS